MTRRLVTLLAVACAVLAAGGCGLGAGEEQPGEVTLTVTSNFGAEPLGEPTTGGAREGDTVMRLLQREYQVETRYGGGFVQEIDGVAGGRAGGRRVDWFYYVNGIEADRGATSRPVAAGDRVWWDHHDWSAAMRIPAVVGSFPEPFLSGVGGKRLPVRLVCAGEGGAACDEVQTRLEEAGVKVGGRSVIEQSAGEEVLRVLVGTWRDLRRDVSARQLEEGPAASGVYARPDSAGTRIELLDPSGDVARTLGPGGGLVAATRLRAQQPTWLVTGTDTVGVAAAAAALTEEELADRFALAVEAGRGVGLPVGDPQGLPGATAAAPARCTPRAPASARGGASSTAWSPCRSSIRWSWAPCWRPCSSPRRARGSAATWCASSRGACRSRP